MHTKDFERITTYINSLAADLGGPIISSDTAAKSAAILAKLHKSMPDLPVPMTGSGPGAVLSFTWRNSEHYLSLEFFPYGNIEEFHENLTTGELWDNEEPVELSTVFLLRLWLAIVSEHNEKVLS